MQRPRSLWLETARYQSFTTSNPPPECADIAIVGGGFMGLSTLYWLHRLGFEGQVVLLEANGLASGSTGRNGGHIWPTTKPCENESEKEALQFEYDSVKLLMEFVESHSQRVNGHRTVAFFAGALVWAFICLQLDASTALLAGGVLFMLVLLLIYVSLSRAWAVDLCMTGAVDLVPDVAMAEDSESFVCSVAETQDNPSKAKFWDAVKLHEMLPVRAGAFACGIHQTLAGQLRPANLVYALMDDVLSNSRPNFHVFTNTSVEKVTSEKSSSGEVVHVLSTSMGLVRCRKVLFATNAYTPVLLPKLLRKEFVRPVKGQVIATRPTTEMERPSDKYMPSVCWSEGDEYLVRTAYDGRVVFGGMQRAGKQLSGMNVFATETEVEPEVSQALRSELKRVISLKDKADGGDLQVEFEWTGLLAYTPDRLPLVGPLPSELCEPSMRAEGLFLCAGFHGEGMPKCFGLGKTMAMLMSDAEGKEDCQRCRSVPALMRADRFM